MCSEAVLPQELSGKKKKLPRGTEIKKLGFWGCPQVIRFCTFKTPSGAGAALKQGLRKNDSDDTRIKKFGSKNVAAAYTSGRDVS